MKTINKRKQFITQFFVQNKVNFSLAVIATIGLSFINLGISWLLQQVIDVMTGSANTFDLWTLTLISIGLIGSILVIGWINFQSKPKFNAQAMRQYKDYAFSLLTKKGINAFSSENTSVYLSALSNDTTNIEANYLNNTFTLVSQSLSFVGAFVMMIWYSPILTLSAILLSLLPLLASLLAGNRLMSAEKKVSDRNASYVATLKDCLSGFSVVKSFKAEKQIIKMLANSNQSAEGSKQARNKLNSIISIAAASAGAAAQLGVFLVGAYLALSGNSITAGVVLVFVNLMNFVIQPIAEVPGLLANRKAALGLIDKLADSLSNNVRESGHPIENKLEHSIRLENVSFSYDQEKIILQDINLKLEKGKSYAIVGGSGSGKSTLLNLLMAANSNYSGHIYYDDNELRDISSESLYDLVSIIQQNVFVFNSTIEDNITMFSEFKREEIDHAIKLSGLSTLIEQKGKDYLCGENGSGLSGGEKQRISIARSLLRRTPVLFVDEATSSLDVETAFGVTNSILDLDGLTKVMVTHTLDEAILRRCDAIITLKSGTIKEMGSFDKLMNDKGYFYSLFTVSQ
ncbi:MAG: ABC transporter ATP-binding protein [Erysipelotrichaceae bacterium]|nr:ABC transporter ATP-binding protein [Erysipelotrichaceae bacterium]